MRLVRLYCRKVVSAVIAAAYAFVATDEKFDEYFDGDPVVDRFVQLHIALWEDEMVER